MIPWLFTIVTDCGGDVLHQPRLRGSYSSAGRAESMLYLAVAPPASSKFNGTVIVELITFLLMMASSARYVYQRS